MFVNGVIYSFLMLFNFPFFKFIRKQRRWLHWIYIVITL